MVASVTARAHLSYACLAGWTNGTVNSSSTDRSVQADRIRERDLETLCDELIDAVGYDGEDALALLAMRPRRVGTTPGGGRTGTVEVSRYGPQAKTMQTLPAAPRSAMR